ncbi:transporter substrate-binding domain-containing protein [Comamonas sp. NoAH]|uniref:transporter substrate-binding domain-containing protein n=1 Tax=Comamonas halotolerans TaxID=3041496 RepID=UPI0024E10F99|nr:transporter substrate-binding domain-containing protein [Comamonas sp. NoAH]
MKSVVKFSLASAALTAAVFASASHAATPVTESPTLQRWQAGGTVVLGVRESATPMSYALGANEKFVGYHTELCEKVVHTIAPKAQLKYMVLTPQNTMPLIQNGTADFNCASMTNSLKRQDQVAFGLTTYVSEVRMAVAKDQAITSFKQLNGKKVSALTGTTAVQILRRFAAEHGIKFQTVMAKDQYEAFLLLESGRVDAFVLDDNMLAGVIAQSRNPEGYKIVGEVIGAEPIAIQFSKADPAIKKAVDDVIRQMISNGELERLYAKWYNQPIPPKQMNLNLPMGDTLRKMLANPNDVPVEQFDSMR